MNPVGLLPFSEPLTEGEKMRLLERLWALLARQAERYTMGESTSVPEETAEDLLRSIWYTLRFEMDRANLTARGLLERDLAQVLRAGQAHLEEKLLETKRLWREALAAASRQGELELAKDLAWLKPFFAQYDPYFFAHRTPWDMGLPIPDEGKQGVTRVEEYLKELLGQM